MRAAVRRAMREALPQKEFSPCTLNLTMYDMPSTARGGSVGSAGGGCAVRPPINLKCRAECIKHLDAREAEVEELHESVAAAQQSLAQLRHREEWTRILYDLQRERAAAEATLRGDQLSLSGLRLPANRRWRLPSNEEGLTRIMRARQAAYDRDLAKVAELPEAIEQQRDKYFEVKTRLRSVRKETTRLRSRMDQMRDKQYAQDKKLLSCPNFAGFFEEMYADPRSIDGAKNSLVRTAVDAFLKLPEAEKDAYTRPEGWRGLSKEAASRSWKPTKYSKFVQDHLPKVRATLQKRGVPRHELGAASLRKVAELWRFQKGSEMVPS